MKDAYDACIPVRMRIFGVVFMRQDHDITVSSWVERVLVAAHIISCVVDAQNFMAVDAIANK